MLSFTIDTKLCSFNDTVKLECQHNGSKYNISIQHGSELISVGCDTNPSLPEFPEFTVTTCDNETIVLEIGNFTPSEEGNWRCEDLTEGSYIEQVMTNLECKCKNAHGVSHEPQRWMVQYV